MHTFVIQLSGVSDIAFFTGYFNLAGAKATGAHRLSIKPFQSFNNTDRLQWEHAGELIIV
jgi:hypothetical protein